MIKRPIRNLHEKKPSRVFDVIVDNNHILLEVKRGKYTAYIPWKDVVYQVKAAKTEYENSNL